MAHHDHLPFPLSTGLPGTYKGVPMYHPPYVDGYREDDPEMTTLPVASSSSRRATPAGPASPTVGRPESRLRSSTASRTRARTSST